MLVYIIFGECFVSFRSGLGRKGNVEKMRSSVCSLSGSGAAGFPLADVAMGLAQGQLPALNSPGSLC